MIAWREVCNRRHLDETNAATTIQRLARMFVSILRVTGMRFEKIRKFERESRAARIIQGFYTRAMQRYLNKLDGKELLKVQHRRVQATLLLMRVVRGHLSRLRSSHIFLVLRDMFQWRHREALSGVIVRLQATARRYVATK